MKNSKGFTLLEVIIASAILSMIFITTLSLNKIFQDGQDRVEKLEQVYQMARISIEKLTDDINMAFIVSNNALLGKTKDGSQIETAFIGDDKGTYDTLDFNTFSHWRMFRGIKESDQAEVGYYVERDPEDSENYRLLRRENPILDNDVTKDGDVLPLAEHVKSFELSYYDNKSQEWTRNWNSKEVDQKNTLPKAVKIELSFEHPIIEDETVNFATIVFIGLWKHPINF